MLETVLSCGLQYAGYGLEVLLFLFLLSHGRWRSRKQLALYVGLLAAVDAFGRPYVLYRFGVSSQEYAYFFWLTDFALVVAAFLLVCALFRRACHHEANLWRHVRLLLGLVFVLALMVSLLSLERNYENLFSNFIIEFQQNVYFTCLILLTMLYVLMQKIENTDDELTLLVSGMGIQFAGPAANLALVYLTPGHEYARVLWQYVHPLCTLGMLLIWFYAVAYAPKVVRVPGLGRKVSELVEAVAREA